MRGSEVPKPAAWTLLERAISDRLAVLARYHGHERTLCPHALGWKNGRPKVLAYQAAGTTSLGALHDDPRQRWRSMFVDEMERPTISDHPWQTADNGSGQSNQGSGKVG